jgi:hypothetical protein
MLEIHTAQHPLTLHPITVWISTTLPFLPFTNSQYWGARGGALVDTLRYKLEGGGFDS